MMPTDHEIAPAEGGAHLDAFTVTALRNGLGSSDRGSGGSWLQTLDAVTTPLLDDIPDTWLVWTWGSALRLLATVSDPIVDVAIGLARREGAIEPAVAALLSAGSGLASHPTADELREDFVVGLFVATLGRLPTTADLQHHVDLLERGMPHDAMLRELMATDESRLARRHPRDWRFFRASTHERRSRIETALRGRLGRPVPAEGPNGDVEARLDALIDDHWRASRGVVDRLEGVEHQLEAVVAELRHGPVSRRHETDVTSRALHAIDEALATMRSANVRLDNVRSVTVVASGDDRVMTIVVDVLPMGAARTGELSARLAASRWGLDESTPDADAVWTRLTLTRTVAP